MLGHHQCHASVTTGGQGWVRTVRHSGALGETSGTNLPEQVRGAGGQKRWLGVLTLVTCHYPGHLPLALNRLEWLLVLVELAQGAGGVEVAGPQLLPPPHLYLHK